MSRLFESSLTGKISRLLVESENCDEPKPKEMTREELFKVHGTDNVDLINAGREPEERVALKETEGFVNELDTIADFMIEFDPYGFANSYDGDADEKRGKLVQDITRDRKAVAAYLNDIVVEGLGTEEQQAEAKRLLGSADLEKFLSEGEVPTPEDLEAEDKKNIEHNKKEIEDRIGELRQAINDGVSDDEKAEMEKEIAELENHLNESVDETADEFISLLAKSTGLREDQVASVIGVLTKYVEDLTDRSFIKEVVDDLKTNLNESVDKLDESVSVATTDGSTVDTQDAASVQSNDGQVTVVTGDTTVVINNTPVEPAFTGCPAGEVGEPGVIEDPVEEVPTEETPIEEPVEDTPVEDEVIEESDDEASIDANVDAKSLAVLKNQGITYMLQIEETSGKTTYWVCDNFNPETNEGDNAEVFDDKESADKEYFERVGLEPTTEE